MYVCITINPKYICQQCYNQATNENKDQVLH